MIVDQPKHTAHSDSALEADVASSLECSCEHVNAHTEWDPLREVIVGRHGWWNFGIGARLLARKIPRELCSISNAKSTAVPALFVSSARDRTVPPRYQQMVIDAHARYGFACGPAGMDFLTIRTGEARVSLDP